ncbi:MAG TPA: hypothetical protein VK778_11385 [Solirubrobacteraceae bacterium]|nr:hypothetical protein [Solirubrobacteraceae bacterium]
MLAVGVSACGSSSATHSGATASTAAATPAANVATASTPTSATTPTLTPAACASTVAGTLGQVGERVYHAAATGDDIAQAVGRVRGSTALASAIDSGNASAAGAALREVLRGQIVRIEIVRNGRVFASAGTGGPAIAPVRGSIPGTSASYVLSVQSDEDYLQVAHQITGAQILMLAGGRRLAGTVAGPPPSTVPTSGPLSYAGQNFQVASLAGTVYPSSALRIALLVPSGALSCPGSTSQTRVETLGRVGERIYGEELDSPTVLATLRRLEHSTAFIDAVAAHSIPATRAAIISFFAAHIHVVRVRVTVGGRLLYDLGGPYVLAPVHGTLRSHGRVVGDFEMSIQDDAGYLKLAHLFTGAEVLMRVAGRQVQGTLSPGPANVPERGAVTYGGRSYEAYSFTAEAFPSGPLRISLLLAS